VPVPAWEIAPIDVPPAAAVLVVAEAPAVSAGEADRTPEYSTSPAVPGDDPDCVNVTPALSPAAAIFHQE
jgi:hypothetical protein